MRLVLTVNASADGYESKEQEIEAIKTVIEETNSSGFTIYVESCEVINE